MNSTSFTNFTNSTYLYPKTRPASSGLCSPTWSLIPDVAYLGLILVLAILGAIAPCIYGKDKKKPSPALEKWFLGSALVSFVLLIIPTVPGFICRADLPKPWEPLVWVKPSLAIGIELVGALTSAVKFRRARKEWKEEQQAEAEEAAALRHGWPV